MKLAIITLPLYGTPGVVVHAATCWSTDARWAAVKEGASARAFLRASLRTCSMFMIVTSERVGFAATEYQ
jgi:hypothetical protein